MGNFDIDAVRSDTLDRLPAHVHWTVDGTSLDFDFIASVRGCYPPPIEFAEGDPDWSQYFIFGKYDYANGGDARPWICIRKTDGSIVGVDAERKHAMFPLNSSLDAFIRAFSILDRYLRAGNQLSAETERLLRQIDPDIYPVLDWRLLVERLSPG